MTSRLLDCLVETLNSKGIAYCHWKSTFYLTDALEKGQDLDLLVARKDAQLFESVLLSLGFKQASDPLQVQFPSVLHFYGLDRATGAVVHLHVFYRIITGESLIKNYGFPLEELLLQNLGSVAGWPVPPASVELVLFVIRIMLKHTTLLEYLLLRRRDGSGYEAVREELAALLAHDAAAGCSDLLAEWLPSVNSALFHECIDALRKDTPIAHRFWLAIRLSRQLKIYNRFSFTSALCLRTTLCLKLLFRRLRGAGKSKQLASGGCLIAFVGPEATGKSTLVKETASWLGGVFDVSSAHLGKPPSTWLTFLPNLVLPLLRRVAPQYRMSQVKKAPDNGDAHNVSLLYALRAVLLAWDRRALAVKLWRKVANGGIVICDRYPSAIVGAMDSARLKVPTETNGRSRLQSYLAKLENRIYRQIPLPDVVIRLTVPVEVAIARNQGRQGKREADDYVLRRHTSGLVPSFPIARTVELDSNQSMTQTISCARRIVWDGL